MCMIWDKDAECMARKPMEELQLERLRQVVQRVYENVPFYRQALDTAKVGLNHIRSLQDISLLPFTTKDDIRNNYPYGLFSSPMKKIVRLHASSGTTGKPTVVGYTKNDIELWAEMVTRLAVAGGATDDDVAQVAFGYGLFTGAFGLHYGLERLGAAIVPASTGNTERQIMLMQDFGTTVLVSTPSYALYLAETAYSMGIDAKSLNVRLGLFGAEGCSEELRQVIERMWGISAVENYGMSELIGPGVSGECECKAGLHINEDHFYPEIIDPVTGTPLPYGETGELVITTMTKEGFPLLRYRTRDITSLNPEPCKCGRTLVRMNKVQGRTDDMLKIRGVNIFPSQIESVLVGIQEIGPHYNIIVRKKGYLDDLEVMVELADDTLLEDFRKLEGLQDMIRHKLRVILAIDATVRLVQPKTIARSEGKAKRIIDLRDKVDLASGGVKPSDKK
ncbi:phenylacetate--CoA ligase family protein [Sporomusa sphaeroides]|uniref:Phenylacetate-coenzyme A ligase n=1 Tax=Sporomusa sphaeroides DSM 2875 TaxID=1337886 RepID=A0ABM9WA52_9FIRM|nr:phenylacetate--CoA ligase [Sporomusa sphaeroides]OLS55251.1 phenylacetate-coenzyme A ligase [Sporomusa sphaeroides DSM 2875]CVK21527.1 Phenylacetate-coenzyme A ligase [Sporomusa sphaeroides DSM 2875]